MSLPDVAEIRRWHPEPGDRLIVFVDVEVSMDQAARIKGIVRGSLQLPDDFPVLVACRPVTGVEAASL